MLQYEKITFNEIDDTDESLQVFYNYDLLQEEIDDLMEEYADEDELPKGTVIEKVELILTVFSRHDFKLEVICNSNNGEQFWVLLNGCFSNADTLISLIPNYGKITIKATF